MMQIVTSLLRAATTRYPLNTPRASILDRLPAIPENWGEFVGKNGLKYRGYWKTDDAVCRSLFWFGDFDPWVNDALQRLALPGTVALDIGANIGATALVLAKAVGQEGRVICFEPMPSNAEMLAQNLAANGFSSISEIEPVALSDKRASARMMTPKNQAGMSRIVEGSGGIEVKCVTFDEWIRSKPDLNISVCKIDVEGHEDRVFEGMKDSLHLIPAFLFERHNARKDDQLFAMLIKNGYKIFRIEKSLRRTYFRELDSANIARRTTDFVAARLSASRLLI